MGPDKIVSTRRDLMVGVVGAAFGATAVLAAFAALSLRENAQAYYSSSECKTRSRSSSKLNLDLIRNWLQGLSCKMRGDNSSSLKDSDGSDKVWGGLSLIRDDQMESSPTKCQNNSAESLDAEGACCTVGAPDDVARSMITVPVAKSTDGSLMSGMFPIRNGSVKVDPYQTSKRKGYLSWDDYFMAIAFLSAQRSKDPNRQVGACLVSQDQVILGIGYNGFPRGCSDDELPWSKMSRDGDPLKTKYPYVCHAEVNAIMNKNHASAAGQRLYVTMFPCNECAKIIIQAGIAEVVYFTDKGQGQIRGAQDSAFEASRRLLGMAKVKVWQYKPLVRALVLEYR